LKVLEGLAVNTFVGSESYSAKIELEGVDADGAIGNSAFYSLQPGKKYNLLGELKMGHHDQGILVPGDYVHWGGGGLNVAAFACAIAPNRTIVPIRYSDVSGGNVLRKFHADCSRVSKIELPESPTSNTTSGLRNEFAHSIIKYLPQRSLETYLASLGVEAVLYEPASATVGPRRNLVISRIHAATREINDKIVFRGHATELQAEELNGVSSFLAGLAGPIGAIVLNSIRDECLFKAAYSLFLDLRKNDGAVICVLAMTKPMQEFSKWMLAEAKADLSSHVLVFNEEEFVQYARAVGVDVEKTFMESQEMPPNVMFFQKIVKEVRSKFSIDKTPKMYVTLGPYGSFGVLEDGHILYSAPFAKPRATVYDTNACGDAYCAAVALLEWAHQYFGKKDDRNEGGSSLKSNDDDIPEHEAMLYIMAVASAAAYCRATNRHGRIDSRELLDLLEHVHLAQHRICSILEDLPGKNPLVYQNGRLKVPTNAKICGVSQNLRRIMKIGGASNGGLA